MLIYAHAENKPFFRKRGKRMRNLKSFLSAICIDGGLFLSVILLAAAAFTWTVFVDWSGPVDNMDARTRATLEDCVMAERSVGDDIYRERPDCRKLLAPRSLAARVPTADECAPRLNDKVGGDDGLDTCGYPGFPRCMDALPPGCP